MEDLSRIMVGVDWSRFLGAAQTIGVRSVRVLIQMLVETTYPLRFKRYEFLPDTGGVGRYRGGLGVRRDIEFPDESGSGEGESMR